MELIDIIKKADVSLIEGDSKLGKLTFALYAYAQNEKIEKITIISSIPKKLMIKRLSAIKNLNDPNINRLIDNSELLCLKEDWIDIKSAYGFDFIYEDIDRIIQETNCDAVILHRPGLMFVEGEYDLARIFLEKFIEIAVTKHGKQVFITSNVKHFITSFLENYTDISLLMQKDNNKRKINVKHSLYPVTHTSYFFIYNKQLMLIPATQNSQESINNCNDTNRNNNKIKRKILVITEDKRFKLLNKYIFGEYFEIEFASNLNELINKLEHNPDVVIYKDIDTNPHFNICSLVKQTSPNSEVIFIANKDYIRAEDKIDATQSRCYEVFDKNFNLEEYILTIEKLTNNFFYSTKIKLLPPQKFAPSYENFCKSISILFNERIYFSIVKTNKFNKEIIKRLRNHDIIYIDEKSNMLSLCLIDVTKEMFKKRLEKKLQLSEYKLTEVIEWDGKC